MKTRRIGSLAMLALLVAGCSTQSSSATPTATPTATAVLQAIAAQPGDLPRGLVTCSWSGGLATYAKGAKADDAGWSQAVLDLWQRSQSGGATAGWIQDLSISESACRGYYSGKAGLVRHVTSLVLLFKDVDGATNTYSANRTPLGLFTGPKFEDSPTQTGRPTGLGPNSIVQAVDNLPMFTLWAAWQRRAYYVLFIGEGFSLRDDELAIDNIDGRIP